MEKSKIKDQNELDNFLYHVIIFIGFLFTIYYLLSSILWEKYANSPSLVLENGISSSNSAMGVLSKLSGKRR